MKHTEVDTCYMLNGTAITALFGFPEFNQFSSIRVRCALPGIEPWRPENSPCFVLDANYSLQRTAYRGR
jgi:hypothetical protein